MASANEEGEGGVRAVVMATELAVATGFGCGPQVKGEMCATEFVIVTGFGSGSANLRDHAGSQGN
jgi:hypothetical protein